MRKSKRKVEARSKFDNLSGAENWGPEFVDRRRKKLIKKMPLVQGKKTQYHKPVFEREESLTFPREIIEQFNNGRLCVQCSSCHGCK